MAPKSRADNTESINLFQRRLDSLARLLCGASQCVAVAIIDGKLCITANELFDKQGKAESKEAVECKDYIKQVIEYFIKLATKQNIDKKEEKKILKAILDQSVKNAVGKTRLLLTPANC